MPDETRAQGIDVSHWRPVNSWPAVFEAGMSFVGIKATNGMGGVDSFLGAHRAGARTQPFSLVIYFHYAKPGDPEAQADILADRVGQLRGNERLALDLEGETPADLPAAPADVLRWTDRFYRRLMGGACSDRRPFLYSSRRIWDMFGNPPWDLASEIDLWAPRYGSSEPGLPAPWDRWTIWQDSQTFPCAGVAQPCDHNVFRGSAEELRTYVAPAPPVA